MNETSKLLEIRLLVDQKVIEETLTRIGIVDKKKKRILCNTIFSVFRYSFVGDNIILSSV
mgnify:CR=1 FL=1